MTLEGGGVSMADQVPSGHRWRGRLLKQVVLGLLVTVVALVLLVALAAGSTRLARVRNFKVEGGSMQPTLASGLIVLVRPKASYERGDIVVCDLPGDPDRQTIKRVVALPGETLAVVQGQLFIDGQVMAEPYVSEAMSYSRSPITMPPGSYYVLGDNRNQSSDSHIWGPIAANSIHGSLFMTYGNR